MCGENSLEIKILLAEEDCADNYLVKGGKLKEELLTASFKSSNAQNGRLRNK